MDIFCKIINNEIPSYKIYEDDVVLAFLDINPNVNGHTLIIPKKHYKDLYDIDDETFTHIINVAKKIGPLLQEKLHADGITLVQNNGLYQEVKHFHLHIRPQYKNKKELKPLEEIHKIITE
ncbi:MAG: HIT domain-containing protein [Bacilli bacterium]|nr:HIT domain-containing protein [Bacilli bacterium]